MKHPDKPHSRRQAAPAQKQRVLADHRIKGKKLIPPYVATLGRPENISWVNTIIPEVIWIALLHETFGQVEGTELALNLARMADRLAQKTDGSFFAAASDFRELATGQKTAILNELAASKQLIKICEALFPLFHYYPAFPLAFLFSEGRISNRPSALTDLKRVLRDLFDKELPRTVFVQATVVYLAFVLGRLKVVKGLTLARFPEIENYPDTEISRRLACALRATVLNFFPPLSKVGISEWPVVFWNRGMDLEVCEFS